MAYIDNTSVTNSDWKKFSQCTQDRLRTSVFQISLRKTLSRQQKEGALHNRKGCNHEKSTPLLQASPDLHTVLYILALFCIIATITR